jgi:hypothetical protein
MVPWVGSVVVNVPTVVRFELKTGDVAVADT